MAWFRTDPQEVLKETVLWTNPSPTSAMADGTTINLSDNIENYDYIKFRFRYSTSNTKETEIVFLSSDIQEYTGEIQTFSACLGFAGNSTQNVMYARYFKYVSETQLSTSANKIGGSEGVASYGIPTQIIGIKRGIDVNPVLDLSLPPDAMYQNTLSNGATYTLAVTQKPKYVVLTLKDSASSSAGSGYLFGIVNVETGVGYRYGYWGSAFRNAVWTNWNSYITSITDNSVTIANIYGTACYTTIGAYY